MPSGEVANDPWPVDGLQEWADGVHRSQFGVGLGSYVVVRAMPWSTVVCWTVEERRVWGKAVCAGFASECGLLPLLARRAPRHVLAPIATEPRQGWILLPDGGETLEGIADTSVWTDSILRYAELQRAVVGDVDSMLAAGCVDLRPWQAVERFERMMHQGHVAEHRWLIDAASTTARRLDAGPVPTTIQHDDLSPANVFSDGTVFDWGDACVAHPFGSLLTALMPGASNRPGSPTERDATRDAYLQSWLDTWSPDEPAPTLEQLREQARLALLLAPIGRIDTWLRAPAAALDIYPQAINRWVNHMLTSDWS